MKWRERISILSRKRNQVRNGGDADENSNNRSFASGSNPTAKDDVETTLSQIRPVIGPDHKSYYILLRGNEDSFTCIQPSKEVVTSLDEVVKNVVNSVRQVRHDGTVLPYGRASKNNQARSYKNSSKKPIESRRAIDSSSSTDKIRMARTVNSETIDSRSDDNSLGTESVVENVVHRRFQKNFNSSLGEVSRTSISVHPLVQSCSGSSGKSFGTLRYDSSQSGNAGKKYISRGTSFERGIQYEKGRNRKKKVVQREYEKVQVTHINHEDFLPAEEESKLCISESAVPKKLESRVQISQGVLENVNEMATIENGFHENVKPMSEYRLVARGDQVLTEEVIAEQVKALIESEAIVIGDNSHIVLTRNHPQEVVLRILPKEVDKHLFIENHQIDQDDLLHRQEHDFSSQANSHDLSLPEENCYFAIPVDAEVPNDSSDTESRIEYLISPLSREVVENPEIKHAHSEDMIRKEVRESYRMENALKDVDSLAYVELPLVKREDKEESHCMENPLQDADPLAIEKLLFSEASFFNQNESLVVIQTADGGMVTQDGMPIPDDLQYLISSLPDDITSVPVGI